MLDPVFCKRPPFLGQHNRIGELVSPSAFILADLFGRIGSSDDLPNGQLERCRITPDLGTRGVNWLEFLGKLASPSQPARVPGIGQFRRKPEHPGTSGADENRRSRRSWSSRPTNAVNSAGVCPLIIDRAGANQWRDDP